ncbi:ATP-binding protein [Ignavigranum ruoffiae]|uniref:ATP-binding protein n=1 Tax=Ignavigranum ruoffiae TaxID=89093 RepID=UPI0020614B9D|nr:ATP-binding protein [Ignavigranum ruoffiae]UPQ85047.1 ATP-binding protein [Ignavigranum ruoffiae]
MKFIGRYFELKELNQEFATKDFSFSIIYGRRRVGKTSLIKQFLLDKPGYYFVAIESNELINLNLLSQAIYAACGNISGLPNFSSFEAAFKFLFEYSLKHKFIFVIDEYPYLAESSPYISSLLQKFIDQYRNESQLFLILCGSSMSFMQEQVLGYKSPLYGRRTSQYKICPFNYLEAGEFVNNYSPTDKAIVFGLTNGVAEYLTYFDDQKMIEENIIELFLKTNGRLYEETSNLLKQELRQPKTYNDILFSIAQGASKLNEIANKVGMASGSLNHYLTALIDLGIIERKTPVLNRKTRRPIYVISDTLFLFWFGYVQTNLNLINLDLGVQVYQQSIAKNLNQFMGKVFEKISIEYYEERIKQNRVPFIPEDYGNWWGNDRRLKQESEIDMLAVGKGNDYLFIEAKWRNESTKQEILSQLIDKSLIFPTAKSYFWLTSKSDFYHIESSDNQVELITLDEMYHHK